MASFVAHGTGRFACGTERRVPRPSVKPCVVRCEARCQGAEEQHSAVKAILPGLLAAALLHASSAHAGVVIEKQQGRKLFQGSRPQQQQSNSGPSLPSPSLPSFQAPSLPSVSLPSVKLPSLPGIPAPKTPEIKAPGSDDFDPKVLALPVSVGVIGAAAFAASKLDSGFGKFMNEGLVKDSTNYTGYEEDPLQARGSPQGFLGLGNLYSPAVPGGKEVANKIKQAVPKGTVPIGKGSTQARKLKGNAKSGGGLRGLFK